MIRLKRRNNIGAFEKGDKIQKNIAFEQLTDEHAAYIKKLVRYAGEVDSERAVFGSSSHQYLLNPVISLGEVSAYEEKYNVDLPEEYKFFLTKVGNGGAGPYYGLYPLEKLPVYHEYIAESGKTAWIDETLTRDIWAEQMKELKSSDDPAYDRIMQKIVGGLNVIGTQGCTFDHLLMNSGSEKGRIVYIDWNLLPENVPRLTGLTFLDWYEQFFREIINDHFLDSYGYIRLGTEEELYCAYQNAAAGEQRPIIESYYRFPKVNKNTIELLLDIDNKELDAIRAELLFRFDLNQGIRLFELLLNGANQEAAIICARRLPKEYYDRYYEKMVYLLYHLDTPFRKIGHASCKQKLLYFLSNCICLSAGDILGFAADLNRNEEERRTAVYVMGKAKDKMRYLECFIHFMKGDSYWHAHAALQAVSKTECPELMEPYRWMWDRYKEDRVMRSNLIVAFRTNGVMKE